MKKKELTKCRSTVKSRRGSLDELRVMQRPTLRATVSATAAAELEKQRGGEKMEGRRRKRKDRPSLFIRG